MKSKKAKIALIIVLSILVISLLSIMLVIISNQNKNVKIVFLAMGDKTEMIFQEEYSSDEIEKIKVDATSSKVSFKQTDSDKIKITAYGIKDEKIEVDQQDNSLMIREKNSIIFLFSIFGSCNKEIIIEIPNQNQELAIKTISGNIEVRDINPDRAEIETTSGNITCANIGKGTIRSTSGDITIQNSDEATIKSTSGKIIANTIIKGTIETMSGDIKIQKCEGTEIKSTSGKITLQDMKRVTAKTVSGDISIQRITDFCQLNSTSGNIKIQTCEAKENSEIKTISGNVSIENKGNIYIETKTVSGNINIENNNRKAEIELNIQTTSGNIKVKSKE